MEQQSLTLQLLAPGLNLLAMCVPISFFGGHVLTERLYLFVLVASSGRYTLTSAYAICYYDWIISFVQSWRFIETRNGMLILTPMFRLDEEVAFIFSAPLSVVKAAYLFCRYYPLAVAPFHLWGFLGDHEQRVCESYYHALSACSIPTIFSAQFILMMRTYAFSGRKSRVLAVLSIVLFGLVGVMIWVSCKQITLSPLFGLLKRSGCFAITDPPTIMVEQVAGAVPGISAVEAPFAYHLGLIFVLTASFDSLNLFIMVWQCVQERRTLGSLGQSILKQGILIYVVMTVLNALTIGTFFSTRVLHEAKAIGPWFAYILPSALVIGSSLPSYVRFVDYCRPSFQSCRLVLMLRRKASPTETKLRNQYSHIVNEALEMATIESHPEDISESTIPSTSKDARAQP
ncbi:hypothetical protein BJY52DRAFT_1418558 [Lactarius psammicola]|nr:hypothetical protein BJY52DRAFT_1418558 [Lactarius psammicola]